MYQQYLEAGQVAGVHGVRGEVKITPWCDSPDFLLHFDEIRVDGMPFAVENSRVHQTFVLAKLRGVDDRDAALRLRGKTVTVDRSGVELPDGAVFISDLIGLPVYSGETLLGKLDEVMTMPAHDVYVVRGEHTWMIPAVDEFLERVDPKAGVIRVRVIEGMQSDAD